jgi:hypothetical protein|nr:MAG TPA: hypothetical protein [Caudoviricetes sp.]
MDYFFDKTTESFFVEGINQIPTGAIPVAEKDYQALIDGRSHGRKIIVDSNNKLSLTPPMPGEEYIWNGSEWIVSNEKQIELFNERKDSLIRKLANKADDIKSELLAGYPQTEIDSFYRQEKEALAWRTDKNSETPMLKQIARIRGIPFDVLVQKVLEKSEQFALAVGVIIGQRQAFEDRLLATKNIEELTTLEKEIKEWKFQAN